MIDFSSYMGLGLAALALAFGFCSVSLAVESSGFLLLRFDRKEEMPPSFSERESSDE